MAPNIETLFPNSNLLSQYIYCYYFFEGIDSDFKSVHYSFPHTYNAVTIYSNGSYQIEKNKLTIYGNGNNLPFTILQGKCSLPLIVDLNGKFSRMTIIFKPLGLNQFIRKPLGKLMGVAPCVFTEWNNEFYNETIKKIFKGESINQRILYLEEFLLLNLQQASLPKIEASLLYLSDLANEKSISDIAAVVNMPIRSFHRYFKSHIGISPVSYRQITRFRQSLENKFFNDQFQKLINVAYQSNFSDQAHFNKLYKQLSGSNPKTLFQSVQQVGNTQLVFKYL